jgi:hypothetical protein
VTATKDSTLITEPSSPHLIALGDNPPSKTVVGMWFLSFFTWVSHLFWCFKARDDYFYLAVATTNTRVITLTLKAAVLNLILNTFATGFC